MKNGLRSIANKRRRGSLLEIVPSIMILLFFVVFPLINLTGLVVGNAVCHLVTNQAASLAAAQPKYKGSLSEMSNESSNMYQTGFAKFVRLRPVNGFGGLGTDLYIHATNYMSNKVTKYGPNSPLPPPVDTATYVYEYQVQGEFDVGPIVNMSSMPFIGTIPGLGPPARLTTSAMRLVEHPEGLSNDSTPSQSFMSTVPPMIPSTVPGPSGPAATEGWNFPLMYQAIAAAGQTVVDEEVLQVDSTNSNWTPTSVQCDSATRVWIDYRSEGSWRWGPGEPMVDADGTPGQLCAVGPFAGIPLGAMIGKVGVNGQPFLLGKEKWNFIPPGVGELFIMCADSGEADASGNPDPYSWTDNDGIMTVRVVAAK